VRPIALESAWFQPWSLTCDVLVSRFAFKCDLDRYAVARNRDQAGHLKRRILETKRLMTAGPLHTFNPVDP
jgi:hypothetical protein